MNKSLIILLLTLLTAGFVYYQTLAPEVVQIDAGELATVQYTASIAHPTGYPLFTILGWLFTRLQFADSVISQINFLALMYGLISLTFVFLGVKILIKEILMVKDEWIIRISPAAVTLTLAFNKTFWSQNTATEVYSLHIVWLAMSVWAVLKTIEKSKNAEIYWYVLAVSLGLGFSNHLTTLMILPGIAWLYFSRYGFKSPVSWKRLGIMILIFTGILICTYGWLMVRASQAPLLNWGNPDTWQRFMTHVSGWQYRVWLFSSTKVTKENLSAFFKSFPSEYSVPALIVMIAGLKQLFAKSKIWAVFFLICFVFTVLYASNYDIHDLDSYFLLAYISAAFFLIAGWVEIVQKWNKVKYIILGISFLPAAQLVYAHYDFEDRSEEYVFADYTRAALGSVPKDAVIMSYQWDYLISPSYYYQYVEGLRPDVCMIDKELLRRSWYYPQMEKIHPDVFLHVQEDSRTFIESVKPMEQGRKDFDAQKLEFLFRKIIQDLLHKPGRAAYVGVEIMQNEIRRNELELPKGYSLIPDQYFLKLVPDTAGYQELPFKPYEIRFSVRKEDTYAQEIRRITATMSTFRAMYELAAGYKDRALAWKNEARRIQPDFQFPRELQEL